MAENLQSIISVITRIEQAPSQAERFGGTLLVTTDSTRSPDRVKEYANLTAVGEDYAATTEPYKVGARYFGQSPFPKPLVIARWSNLYRGNRINGASIHGTVDAIKNINTPALTITVDSSPYVLTAISLSSLTTHKAIADHLNTRLGMVNLVPANIVIDYVDGRYIVADTAESGGTTLRALETSGNLAGTSAVSGLAIEWDGIDSETAATYVTGNSGGEDFSDFITAVQQENNNWYWIIADTNVSSAQDAPDNPEAISAWVEGAGSGNRKAFIMDSSDVAVFTPTSSNSTATIATADRERTTIIWTAENDYKSAALAAKFSAVNFNTARSLITASFRVLAGTAADVLTDAQIATLEGYGINYYRKFGPQNIVRPGVSTKNGSYPDATYWLDWFVWQTQRSLYALLTSENTIPQTQYGLSRIVDEVEAVCRTGVFNGGIAPGQVTAQTTEAIRTTTGNDTFNGFLSRGFMVFIAALGSRSSSEVADRHAPQVYVWLNGSDAVHNVDIDATFS